MEEKILLYTRWAHGGDPVTVHLDEAGVPTRFDLVRDGEVISYPTFKSLHIDLYGRDLHMQWKRYFYLKQHSDVEPIVPLFEMFPLERITQILETALEQSGLTVDATVRPLGIDLQRRGHEVAKLLYAGFGRKIQSAGYDPDDVLQEVYRGLLARNNGKCPWDPAKSSFGHYVHMVCGCVVANYHRQAGRRSTKEQVGMRHYSDGKWETVDVASADVAVDMGSVAAPDAQVKEDGAMDSLVEFIRESDKGASREAEIAVQLVPLKAQGYSRTEISDLIGVSPAMVSRGLSFLRDRAREWAQTLSS